MALAISGPSCDQSMVSQLTAGPDEAPDVVGVVPAAAAVVLVGAAAAAVALVGAAAAAAVVVGAAAAAGEKDRPAAPATDRQPNGRILRVAGELWSARCSRPPPSHQRLRRRVAAVPGCRTHGPP